MKKLFASTVAGMAFAAGAAAQDNADTALPIQPHQILWSDEASLIVSSDFNINANSYVLMCPGYGSMREFFTKDPNVAIMVAHHATRASVTESLQTQYGIAIQNVGENLDRPYGPTYNVGMIAADGTILPVHNPGEMIDQLEKTLAAPGDIPSARMDNDKIVQKMRSYAENYCFARG